MIKDLPDAMVIKLGDTHFANGAMFGACWLSEVAGFAFVVFLVDDFIKVGLKLIDLGFVVLFRDLAWRD